MKKGSSSSKPEDIEHLKPITAICNGIISGLNISKTNTLWYNNMFSELCGKKQYSMIPGASNAALFERNINTIDKILTGESDLDSLKETSIRMVSMENLFTKSKKMASPSSLFKVAHKSASISDINKMWKNTCDSLLSNNTYIQNALPFPPMFISASKHMVPLLEILSEISPVEIVQYAK